VNTRTEPIGSGSFVLRFVFVGCVLIYAPIIVGWVIASGSDGVGTSATEPGSSEISLNEFVIDGPDELPAGPVTLTITNDGVVSHNLVVKDMDIGTPEITPGGQTELDLGSLSPGDYELYCTIKGHRQAGMVHNFTVTDPT
jgi:hypothetical protein